MDAFLVSTTSVAIAEIGDKTQLLALLLAARFSNRTAIILGIFIATLLNHFLATLFGEWVISYLSPNIAQLLVGLSFIIIGLWILIPDKPDKEDSRFYRYGPLLATTVLFFVAEIGDKTQVATVFLAAKYQQLTPVLAGTTIGMLLANVPVVLMGHMGSKKLPLKWIRLVCAILFGFIGVITLIKI
ncbi:TMEM165/GDT1 family protein [Shewanella sp. 202IG2-18]|uniref:TMEM165/GDT1 family protein n=1 Tax=Parashewanella hymeniacidonis TaxID=2807618 RepID=UPI00195FE4F4|nr:TMEM165/GDT1 family protein [Parashewanella hymeniacidonis]MBM7073802.1 TMEM165/GDT1 family protein [Parashewanella hymeniacidonis]